MTTPHRTLREAAQMALDALLIGYHRGTHDAIAALREALNAPGPEPVGTVYTMEALAPGGDLRCHATLHKPLPAGTKLYAAPPAAPASQWMPIETAPKDGALFLCWVDAVRCGETDEGQQYEEDVSQLDFCYWRTQSDTPDGGWFDPCCGQIGDRQRVTHWMPLPAAPDNLRDAAEKVAPAAPVPDGMVPNAGEVICPNCAHQFRAIPENVQSLLLASGHEPPFTASPAAPVVPLTDEQIRTMWKSSEFRGNGGQVDWFCEGIRAAEAHHGITGGKP